MKRVYICAPLSDNPNQDVIKAVRFGEYAMKECGAAPLVPHFYILMTNPQSDKETEQRKLADFSLIWMIDELWVFGDYWTDEMMEEISRAEMLKIPIKYHSDNKVKSILKKYNEFPTAMQGLGYKEVVDYLNGNYTKEEMIEKIKMETRRYAKRQLTWFRKNKQTIWLEGTNDIQNNINIILEGIDIERRK